LNGREGRKSGVNNHLIPIFLLFASGVWFAVVGCLCVAKPDKMADYARRRYFKMNKFFQKWPFANMVLEPWYPTYLRFMGLFFVAFALMFIFIGFFVTSK
jgi:hypothetical protein